MELVNLLFESKIKPVRQWLGQNSNETDRRISQ